MRIQSVLMFAAGCLAAVSFGRISHGQDAPAPTPIALVGCAHIHTPAFIKVLQKRTDVKVKYVWDHDADRAKKDADELGAAVVSDPQTVWSDPAIKAVVICSETDRHVALVTAAATAHKHVYAEKPLGLGATDAWAMAKALDDAGLLFETGYFMRGDPRIRFVKEQIEQGAFGKITRIRGSNCHSGALGGWFDGEYRWMADPKVSGIGGFGDLGTHSLDIMLWLMGSVSKVTATVSNGTARYPNCDEFGEGILQFENGTIGTLAAGWDDVANPVTLEVCGTEGHAVIVNGSLQFESKKTGKLDQKAIEKQLPPKQATPLELFLDAVNGKKDMPLVTVREAAYRSAVTEALYQGAHEQKWVTVPPAPAK